MVFAQSQFKDISNEVSECDEVNEVNESNIAATQLSVDIQTAASVTGLPTLVLRQNWAKASELIFSTSQILPAPGSSSFSRMVASKSQKKPHYVLRSSDGQFECDENCEAFKQRYTCAHSVAAAEDNKMLIEFIEKYALFSRTSKGSRIVAPNFTRLSMSSLPHRTAGQKGGKAP